MNRSESVLLVASTGSRKPKTLRPYLLQYGVNTRWLEVGEVEEDENKDPYKVLKPKAIDYASMSAGMVSFLVETGIPVSALAAMDVLGLDMPEVSGGHASLGVAANILKKPVNGLEPEKAVAEHFKSKLRKNPVDGWRWDVYIAGVAGIPVDRRGDVRPEKIKAFWGQPLWLGYPQALVELMADEEKLWELVDCNIILPDTITNRSIVGLQAQNLLRSLGKLTRSKHGKGCAMRVIHTASKLDVVVDGSLDENNDLKPVFELVDGALANVTPDMARMIGSWMRQLVN